MRNASLPLLTRPKSRLISSTHDTSPYIRPNTQLIVPKPGPTTTNEDGTKTLRLRQHGNKPLPLPPLFDPIAIAAKERYKKPRLVRREEDVELTEFQRELGANVHARALATPVRQCAVTKARLPSHFLLPFSTALTYSTPGLSDSTPDNVPSTNAIPNAAQVQPSLIPLSASHHRQAQRNDTPNQSSTTPSSTATGSSTYILAHQPLLSHLNAKSRWSTIVTQRMQEAYAKAVGRKRVRVDKEWSWHTGMVERVLGGLREEVRKELGRVMWLGVGGKECSGRRLVWGWRGGEVVDEEGKGKGKVGAVLRVKDDEYGDGVVNLSGGVVVYALPELLGEANLDLHLSEDLRGEFHLAVLRHSKAVKLFLALERLRIFLLPRDIPAPIKRKPP